MRTLVASARLKPSEIKRLDAVAKKFGFRNRAELIAVLLRTFLMWTAKGN